MATHNLSQEQLNTLRSLQQQGRYAEAWQKLAQWGDTYADDAANVTGEPANFYGEFMKEMVRQHWGNTAGETAYDQYFDSVASMHLNNYLTILEDTPNWPTSAQIEGSYRDSVEFYGLPASTAFDGVFTQSVGTATSGEYDWPHALDMDPARIVPSDVFDDIGFVEASLILADTIYDTIAEFVERGWEWLEDVAEYATDAVLDLLDDVRRSALEKLKELVDTVKDAIEDVYDSVRNLFDDAKKFIPRRDPLVLDLDGDGIETVAATGAVLFDHDGDGVRSGTGWIASDDGLLVLDRNGNGLIDNGGELFGADTVLSDGTKATSGFAALADLDSNDDGIFSADDAEFSNVRVWRDLNQDGISQVEEMFTLDQLGIASINLTPTTTVDLNLGNGNVVDNRGTFTRTDGTTGLAGDLLLAMNHFFSDFTGSLDPVAVTDEASQLPGLKGSGAVRNLVEAASLSTSLLSAVQAFVPGISRNTMRGELDTIVSLWAGTSTMESSEEVLESSGSVARTIYYHAEVPASVTAQGEAAVEAWKQQQHAELAPIIAILEQFNGSSLVSFQNDRVSTGGNTYVWKTVTRTDGSTEQVMSIVLQSEQISTLLETYAELKESIYARLVLGTRLDAYMGSLGMQFVEGQLQFDFTAFNAMLNGKRQSNLGEAFQDLVDLYRHAGSFLGSAGWNGAAILESWIEDARTTPEGLDALTFAGIDLATGSVTGTSGNDVLWGGENGTTLRGGAGGDLLVGNAGNDALYGDNGQDILLGGLGNDTLNGGAGDDRLIGGVGNDNLTGGDGSDVYSYELGDGQDTINNYDVSSGRFDVLVLGEGITPDGVTATRLYDNLILSIDGTTDRITVNNYFASDGAGGYQLDEIRFADGTIWTVDVLKPVVQIPTEGNDNLYGYAGSDTLAGLAGNDAIYGYGGNDVLEGGLGNDSLSGGAGSDTYIFNAGDGQDTIDNYDNSTGRYDVLQLGEGIAPADVTARRSGTSLVLTFVGSSDRITITNYFESDAAGHFRLDEIRFADGSAWTVAIVKSLVQVPTEGNDNLYGYAGNDNLSALAGDDAVYGYGGNDVLEGGAGNDFLSGGTGSDVYRFNAGDGQDTIDNYDSSSGRVDVLEFGEGISAADVTARRSGLNLILTFAGSTDRITVSNYFDSDAAGHYRLDEIRFANGTTWDVPTVKDLVQVSTQGDDALYGYATNDNLAGAGGNDTLYGYGGNDVLAGGSGNDALDGGTGSDTYLFDLGDGQDIINNYDTSIGRTDVLLFGQDVAPADVTVRRVSGNLVLTINGTDDRVTVSNYFSGDAAGGYQLDEIRFAGAPGTVWDVNTVKALVLAPTSGDDTLQGYASNDVIAGGDGNDTISGNAGDDVLQGEAGNDALYGGAGHDTLVGGVGNDSLNGDAGNDVLQGGTGNDTLSGGAGSDTYLFNAGDGQDVISNYDTSAGRVDVLQLGEGILPADVTARRSSNDLVLTFAGSDDRVTVSNCFIGDAAGNYQLDQIRFADETVWDVATVKALVLVSTSGSDTLHGYASDDVIASGDGNDTIYGNAGDDLLQGEAGNDALYGGAGHDTLVGGEGNDTLNGDAGDDILQGGTGNDTLNGGAGSDGYLFNVGDGQDVISNYDTSAGRVDVLQLGEGVLPADVTARRSSNDLVLTFAGSDDRVTVSNYFIGDAAGNYQLDQIRFADQTTWDVDAVKALVLLPTAGADTLQGYASDDTIAGGAGNDTIYGNAGNDTLDGQDGSDTVHGGSGDDTLLGGAGADTLNGDAGDDLLDGGADDDILRGGAGSDHLTGGLGNDQLEGGEGDDHYHFAAGDGQDTINDTQGLSTIHLSGLPVDQVYLRRDGTALVLRFIGSSTDHIRLVNFFDAGTQLALRGLVIDTGEGTPWALDAAAVDAAALLGTSLDDVIDGNTLDNTIVGLAGDDTLRGGAGADGLDGGAGDDALYGEAGNDVLVGGDGNDLLDGGVGADQLAGGAGDDIYVVDNAGDVVTEAAGAGVDTVQSSVSFALPDNVEHLTLTGSASIDATGNALDNTLTGNSGNNHLQGLGGNDVLVGNAGDDVLDGGAGNDQLDGGVGADLLTGGAGNDVLDGGAGVDQLVGGTGDDTYRVDESGDVIVELAGEGLDVVQSTAYSYALSANVEQLTLVQGSGAYEGVGNALDNVLTGNGNDNRLDGGAGADTLIGGLGNDTYVVDNVGDVVVENAGEGTDTVESSISYVLGATLENLTLLGTANLDATGNAGDNAIRGNAGNNRIEGGDGADTLYGGAGNDYYVAVSASDRVYENAGEGIDTVERVFETNLVLENNVENLILGAGVTTGNGNGLDNTITGNAGDNTLGGWDGDDTLHGLDGDDSLFGGNGIDTLFGGAGDDYLDGGAGVDYLEGGAGNDVYITDDSDDVVVEAADGGTDQVQSTASYALSANIENLFLTGSNAIGGTGNDLDNYIAGNGAANTIHGGGGADTIVGGGGNDTLIGGTGDDKYVFDASSGSDVVDNADGGFDGVFFTNGITRERLSFGRDGDDLLIFVDAASTPSVTVLNHFLGGNAAIDYVQPDGGYYLTTAEINQIVAGGSTGGEYDQVIEGTAAGEQLVGSSGKDLIKGLAGDDQLFGMGGNDTLQGGDGDDYLAGGNGSGAGSGDDRLEGGAGADTLTGEDGVNALIGGAGNDSYVYGGGQDTIDNTGGGNDGVFFNDGITADDLTFSRDGDDLLITVAGNANGFVRVTNHFLGGDLAIDFVQPASGNMLNTAAINALADAGGGGPGNGDPGAGGNEGDDNDYPNVVTGTAAGEQLLGTSGRDLIQGQAGDDDLFGFGGDDKLVGGDGADYLSGGNGSFSGSGNDILIGGAGDDTLVGEDGNDMLIGGTGNDTYYYASGSGADTVDNTGGGTDWLYFADIASGRLSYHQDGDDLVVLVDGDLAQSIRVLDHFLGGEYAISYVQPNGGYAIPASQIANLLTPLPGSQSASSGDGIVMAESLAARQLDALAAVDDAQALSTDGDAVQSAILTRQVLAPAVFETLQAEKNPLDAIRERLWQTPPATAWLDDARGSRRGGGLWPEHLRALDFETQIGGWDGWVVRQERPSLPEAGTGPYAVGVERSPVLQGEGARDLDALISAMAGFRGHEVDVAIGPSQAEHPRPQLAVSAL